MPREAKPTPVLRTRLLTEQTWPDFVELVEANNGVWGGCWCMGFHPQGFAGSATGNRAAKRELVRAGTVHQLLVYDTHADTGTDTHADTGTDTHADTGTDTHADTGTDTDSDTGTDTDSDTGTDTDTDTATCVGWCQFGSPAELPNIKNSKVYAASLVTAPDWRIGCIFTGSKHRGRGVARAAVAGVLDEIRAAGGGVVEAYPEQVDLRPPQRGAYFHTGPETLFEEFGFERDRKIAKWRWVMRLEVRSD